MDRYNFSWEYIVSIIPDLIQGIEITVFISSIAGVSALILGLTFCLCRLSKIPLIYTTASLYVEFFRNTPLLIQLYLCYAGLPHLGISLPAEACGIIALSIYTSAYITEIIRSGIQSIPKEQFEASRALGFSPMKTLKLIIFPQAFRIVIPPLGNQFINIVKNSSLVSFITVTDLYYIIYKGSTDDFRSVECFLVGAILYIFLVGIVVLATNLLEQLYKMPGGEQNALE